MFWYLIYIILLFIRNMCPNMMKLHRSWCGRTDWITCPNQRLPRDVMTSFWSFFVCWSSVYTYMRSYTVDLEHSSLLVLFVWNWGIIMSWKNINTCLGEKVSPLLWKLWRNESLVLKALLVLFVCIFCKFHDHVAKQRELLPPVAQTFFILPTITIYTYNYNILTNALGIWI